MHHIVWSLKNRHRQLEQLIRRELGRPRPDHDAIQDLKRRKLQLKDRIFMAEAGLEPIPVRVRH